VSGFGAYDPAVASVSCEECDWFGVPDFGSLLGQATAHSAEMRHDVELLRRSRVMVFPKRRVGRPAGTPE
jgi:hypothetical protein